MFFWDKPSNLDKIEDALLNLIDKLDAPTENYYTEQQRLPNINNPNIVGNEKLNNIKLALSKYVKAKKPLEDDVKCNVARSYRIVKLNGGYAVIKGFNLLNTKGFPAKTKLDVHFYENDVLAFQAMECFVSFETESVFARELLNWRLMFDKSS